MAQRDDELARFDTRWPEWLWGKITKVTLGYGYQPWRALLFLAAVVALSCVLAVVLGAHGALAQTKDTAAPGQPCTMTQRVSVGLDLNLPVGRHQPGPGGLRAAQGRGQGYCCLAGHRRLGAAGAGVGVRGAVHRRVHLRRPQDLTANTTPHRRGWLTG